MSVISEQEIFLRLLLAAFLGAMVGLDRERQNQPAGLRTHIILVTGSALAMTLSINLSMQFLHIAPNGDPARLAAQVLSGIGFLGAGAILRYGPNIKGLTTATSLWTMAVIGLVVGAGYYWIGVGATALLLAVLTLLNYVEKRLLPGYTTRQISLSCDFRNDIEESVNRVLSQHVKHYTINSLERHIRHKRIRISITVKVSKSEALALLTNQLAQINGVRAIRIE